MPSMSHTAQDSQDHRSAEEIVLGVDTHKDTHVASVITILGVLVATAAFPTTTAGYRELNRRRRHRLDQPKRFTTETVYAITDRHVHQARPAHFATWIRGHWSIENKVHRVRDVTYDEDRSQVRIGTGPQVMAALRAAIGALRLTGVTNIAAANRHHARGPNRPLALVGVT